MGVCFYPKRHPIAGGFTPRAFGRNLTVDRPNRAHIGAAELPIRPGDTVNVQERWF